MSKIVLMLVGKIGFLTIILFSCKTAGRSKNSENTISHFFTQADFDRFFPNKSEFYSYHDFITAVTYMSKIKVKIETRGQWIYKITRTDKTTGQSTVIRQDKEWDELWAKNKSYESYEINYADFCSAKSSTYNKKELAAFFAHAAHETRNGVNGKFDDGLMLKNEIDTTLLYITPNLVYPGVSGQKYYGRGPLQISYNGNYGFASQCIFGDKDILLKNPGLVSEKPDVAFETAIYYWMTPQGVKPSCHDMITDNFQLSADQFSKGYRTGFGMTINIINGALECNKGESSSAMQDRILFYKHFLSLLGIDDKDGQCSCGQMTPFEG